MQKSDGVASGENRPKRYITGFKGNRVLIVIEAYGQHGENIVSGRIQKPQPRA
jgi:hypothetical protein